MRSLAKFGAVVVILSFGWLVFPPPASRLLGVALAVLSGPSSYLAHARSPTVFGAEWQIYAWYSATVLICAVPVFFATRAKSRDARVANAGLAIGLWLLFGWCTTLVMI